jgi:glycosyltransferase involved in cell wall biosynthesis
LITAGLLRRWPERFDVVHTWPLAAHRTLKVARERGELGVREAPNTHTAHAFAVVAKEHDALGVAQEKNNSHTFNGNILARELREYAAAGLILAPSELARKTFLEAGVPREKLALKSYGFDPQLYASSARAKSNDTVTFSFIARCEPRKGLHLALEAWLRSGVAERSKFRITGRYVEGYRERILPLLQHPNVSEQDFVSDLRPIYRDTDILVLPSIEDGSALVTYEAQASGCALLVSDASGARITNGVEGFMHHAGDIDTLAQHMRALVEDPTLLAKMQESGPLNVQKYTWERATEALIEAYRAAL